MNDWLKHLSEVSAENLAGARQAGEEAGEGAAETWLLSRSLVNDKDILRAKSAFFRLPYITLGGYHPSQEAIELITEEQARKLGVIPLFCLQERIFVAMPDPYDLRCEDFIRKLTGRRVKPVLASAEDIKSAITRKYLAAQMGTSFAPQSKLVQDEDDDGSEQDTGDGMTEMQSPVVKAVWKVISQAIRLGASDIHLEPDKGQLFLRYRIDGTLHDYPPPDFGSYSAVVSRIKVISSMDIAERRLPQDGRVSVELDNKTYDLRVSLLPNVHGEGICIRVLDPESTKLDLSVMGFDPDTLERYDRVIRRPHGIVLVTGPTGSGKSTTLYATLSRIVTRDLKIITVEDPVEYKIAGLTQVPVRPDIGFTFEAGLKAILRHDPDIIMLGEIRDLSSAEMAFRAALTGHLLFSTLHTNSAALAVTRLMDMGVPAFQVMAAMSGVLAQRLIRKLCPDCKAPVTLSKAEMRILELPESPQEIQAFKAVGCASCQNIGYRGRTAIHEFLEITPEMRKLSDHELADSRLEEMGRAKGFRTLRESAVLKLLAGITSMSEVLALTAGD
jgi:type IV pilus assembly protein PilB